MPNESEGPFGKTPSLLELMHHLPVGKLEVITGVGADGSVHRSPLSKIGHTLLTGGSNGKTNTVLGWIAQLCAKNTPEQIHIAVMDLTSRRDLAKTLAQASKKHLAHIAQTPRQIDQTLFLMQQQLSARKKSRGKPDAWLVVIENVTELQSNPRAWNSVQALLREGKAAQMYVLATTRQLLLHGPLHDAFDTHMTFAPAPEDTGVDALSLRVADLSVDDAQPIVYLRIWFLSSLEDSCARCEAPEAKFLLEWYVPEGKLEAGESFTRQWYQAILSQVTSGLQVHVRQAICEACASRVLDEFLQQEGAGHVMLEQSALVPIEELSKISLVGLMQVGTPGVALACVCANTLEQLLQEISEKGIFNPEMCPQCNNPLSEELCVLCQQRKCWSCEGETAGLLKICTSCMNQYNTSVLSHFADPHAANKRWCDSCKDWMPVPHQHKPPRVWRS
jgi:hypothetical protein